MNLESIKVRIPSEVVFLCGGAAESDLGKPPACLRDVFNRNISTSAPTYNIILAEKADPLTTAADYRDLLSFEADIAQIVGVILLFAESAGSLAELGAFSATKTIAPSLLAVVNDNHYNQISFIKRGPILHLEQNYGDDSVLVLDCAELRIGANGDINNINVSSFMENVVPVVKTRLAKRQFFNAFNVRSSGHHILILVGLCQEYGALTIGEIRLYFSHLGIENARLSNYIYCAELFGWIAIVRKGNHIF